MPPPKADWEKFRTRKWACVCYGFNLHALEMLKFSHCIGLAACYHDKDDKEPHTHVLVYFENAVTLAGVKKTLDMVCSGNILAQPLKKPEGAYDYLTHENSPEKYRYSRDDVITWGDIEKLIDDDSIEYANERFVVDLMTMDRYSLAVKYGRDYIKNYRQYATFVQCLIADMKGNPYQEDIENEKKEYADMKEKIYDYQGKLQ